MTQAQNCLVFTEPPKDFSPKVEVAGCLCEFEDKVLMMKRHPDRPQGETWGSPAGKLEAGENPRTAVVREVYEETGLKIDDYRLEEVAIFYARLPHIDYIYHSYRTSFEKLPELFLGLDEHTEARWVTIEEAKTLPLIGGGLSLLIHYEKLKDKKNTRN